MITDAMVFAIEGSMIDVINYLYPNYSRESSVWMEKWHEDSLSLYPVVAHHPAFFEDTGAIYLEPDTINLVTKNQDMDDPVWIKGSGNITVRPDYVTGPYGSYRADIVRWDTGIGVTQEFRRTFTLKPGSKYTLSIFASLRGGEIGPNDVVYLRNGVVGASSISLSELSLYKNKWRILEITFTVSGKEEMTLPSAEKISTFTVVSVSNNTVTLSSSNIDKIFAQDGLVEGRISFDNGSNYHEIAGNSSYSGTGEFTISVLPLSMDLTTIGVNTNSIAILNGSSDQEVELVFYVESTLSLTIGAIQLEKAPFRTSMILQGDYIQPRSQTNLEYRVSPIGGLDNFGVFIDLEFWRGEGNIIDMGNIGISILGGRLRIWVDPYEVLIEDIPASNFLIYLQVSSQKRNILVYINGVLVKNQLITDNFVASPTSNTVLTSSGVRAIRRIMMFDRILLDGNIEEGEIAKSEIAELFSDYNLIPPSIILGNNPSIDLGKVLVPSKVEPTALTYILGVNNNSKTITVLSVTGFSVGQDILVYRQLDDGTERIISYGKIESISSNNIQLDSVVGVKIDDILIYGQYNQPGQASVRFHFDPIDPQEILGIDPVTKKLTLDTVGSFSISRAFIRTIDFQEVAEVLVEEKDEIAQTITVSSIEGIEEGMIITQPYDELLVHPANYFVELADPVIGIGKPQKYTNGVVFTNYNDVPVEIRPIIQVLL